MAYVYLSCEGGSQKVPLINRLDSSNLRTVNNSGTQVNPLDLPFTDIITMSPCHSYLDLTYRQFLQYVLDQRPAEDKNDHNEFINLIHELQEWYSTIDKSREYTGNLKGVQDLSYDTRFLIFLMITESAKFTFHKRSHVPLNQEDLLDLLGYQLSSELKLTQRQSRCVLLEFLFNLDKLSRDCVPLFATRKGELPITMDNPSGELFRTWCSSQRPVASILSLLMNLPAHAYYHMNLKLMATAAAFVTPPMQGLAIYRSVDSIADLRKSWRHSLIRMAQIAKRLVDSDLLAGLFKVANTYDDSYDYMCIKAMSTNATRRFQATYDLLKDRQDKMDEFCLIEFIEACIEIDLFDEATRAVDRLKSDRLKNLYRNLLISLEMEECPPKYCDKFMYDLGTWSNIEKIDAKTCNLPLVDEFKIIVPTCLNALAKSPQRTECCIQIRLRDILNSEYIAKLTLGPTMEEIDREFYLSLLDSTVYTNKTTDSLELLRCLEPSIHQILYRQAHNMRVKSDLRAANAGGFDEIQLNAIKFNLKQGNRKLALDIAEDLGKNGAREHERLKAQFVTVFKKGTPIMRDEVQSFAKDLAAATNVMYVDSHSDLVSKTFRKLVKGSLENQNQEFSELDLYKIITSRAEDWTPDSLLTPRWENALIDASLPEAARNMWLLAMISNEVLEMCPNINKLLNETFRLDIKAMEFLCQTSKQSHKFKAIEIGSRLIARIISDSSRLDSDCLDRFVDDEFQTQTHTAWMTIESKVLAVILNQKDLDEDWARALTELVKHFVRERPQQLIYRVIVNRLDLESDMERLCLVPVASGEIVPLEADADQEAKIKECDKRSMFWNKLLEVIKTINPSWPAVVAETEMFLREIRYISFLFHEYFQMIIAKAIKKFKNFQEDYMRRCDPDSGSITDKNSYDELAKSWKATCFELLRSLNQLINHGKSVLEKPSARVGAYELMYYYTFMGTLEEINRMMDCASPDMPSSRESVEVDVGEIINALNEHLNESRTKFSKKTFFLKMISPKLSALKSSLVPLPNYSKSKSSVTIHKIIDNIDIVYSKTCPKKFKLVGSDGCTRSYLLKAHEDLRQDQLLMEVFDVINCLLAADKNIAGNYVIRRYSVTPTSQKSGIIEWVDAPSLGTKFREWMTQWRGFKVVKQIYDAGCPIVCSDMLKEPKSEHIDCKPSSRPKCTDVFYYKLWTHLRSDPKYKNTWLAETRPSNQNTYKLRAEIDQSVYESILRDLEVAIPDNIIANDILRSSMNPYIFWKKTRQFIQSYATMAIVGYIVGLGDRHAENILLDPENAQVIHIDYGICFEVGKDHRIPEKVPFRLTQNIIGAFGFAGLAGGFTRSSVRILEAIRSAKKVVTEILDPINLGYMVRNSHGQIVAKMPNEDLIDLISLADARTAEEQVESLIAEATSLKNKAPMFEGWTAWF